MRTNGNSTTTIDPEVQKLWDDMGRDVYNNMSPLEHAFNEMTINIDPDDSSQLYTEAVFSSGKETMMPLVEHIQKIKDLLEEQITAQDKSTKEASDARQKRKSGELVKLPAIKEFDPKSFWRHQLFKDFEDKLTKIFGFRNVETHPYIEKYDSKSKTFESKIMNCEIYHADRFPIQGLVTDKGFYDKSRSLTMQIYFSLGLFRALTAEEIMAVFLHEFGHSIDPALVDIKYTQVNILSKYLTDRKNAINKDEKRLIEKTFGNKGVTVLTCLVSSVRQVFSHASNSIFGFIQDKFSSTDKAIKRKLDKVRKMVESDKGKFDRRNFAEAYADNFARMYGFGPQLISGIKKMTREQDKLICSRFDKERKRQEYILYITGLMIKDVHKTDLHRIRSLIKEYKDDIDNPNISATTKKQLKEDLAELEKILDEYMNNFSEFQNRVNRVINEELEKIEVKEDSSVKNEPTKPDENKKAAVVKENFIFFDESTKSEHPLKKKMDEKCPLEHGDRSKIDEKFGKSKACSWAKDKDGYFCYTHRCRSKSYPTIDDIPQKDVDFVRSTC